jgi:PadR family transcriptional regulator PadR
LKNADLLNYRWVESSGGPPRKYFSLTEKGSAFYQLLETTWREMADGVERVINSQGRGMSDEGQGNSEAQGTSNEAQDGESTDNPQPTTDNPQPASDNPQPTTNN